MKKLEATGCIKKWLELWIREGKDGKYEIDDKSVSLGLGECAFHSAWKIPEVAIIVETEYRYIPPHCSEQH
jgi:hypothetical protein